MASKIELISNAMILLGGNPISNMNEGTEGVVATSLYENVYRGLLSLHPWRFAIKKVKLSKLTDKPLNEFIYMYQLPSDLITVLRVSNYVYADYEIYEDKIYTNDPDFEIDYIFRCEEVNLPAYFILALQYLLASQFAIPLTDNSTKAQLYNEMYQQQLKTAKYIDSSSRPQDAIVDNPLMVV